MPPSAVAGRYFSSLLEDTDTTEVTINKLRSILPSESFQLVPWSDLADFYNKTVVLFSKQVEIIKIIIGVIIVLTISNIQTMSVLERTTEIGTILAVGVRSREIWMQFLLEGLLLGLAGGVVGVVSAICLAELISYIGIPMPPPPGMARGFTGQIIITAQLVFDAIALSTITTLLASLMPAWKASRLNIVDALRTNQ
ncbi:FtsX-like permease family protein [Dechloromonas sp. ARDL1]|uniref:FtsX-like permease family protein n=1 Tax=Dechloromonas sp. ARDL1 TaxID=3322121 RepID=UPI003DA7A2E1